MILVWNDPGRREAANTARGLVALNSISRYLPTVFMRGCSLPNLPLYSVIQGPSWTSRSLPLRKASPIYLGIPFLAGLLSRV
ncbi:MAG: hypothetical protein R2806_11110 [Saprospiraceae bacterium]